jgi:hypothetical protein
MPTITHTPRQAPVAAALDQLLADAEAKAMAIQDNALDEGGQPLDINAVHAWCDRLEQIKAFLVRASFG